MKQPYLSLSEARQIRRTAAAKLGQGWRVTQVQNDLAEEWGVHVRTIQRIVAGTTHKEPEQDL